MQPALTHISFINFRSYKNFNLNDIGKITIFTGENGVGKTNILDGIYFLTRGKSFRPGQLKDSITFKENKTILSSDISYNERFFTINIILDFISDEDNEEMILTPVKKRILINGKPKKQEKLVEILPSVLFSPDDIEIIKSGNSIRRNSFDDIGILLSKNYRRALSDYKKAIEYKNKLLKSDFLDRIILESLNETISKIGAIVLIQRYRLVKNIEQKMISIYEKLSGGKEQLKIKYDIDVYNLVDKDINDELIVEKQIKQKLEAYIDEEIHRKRALIGPHTDKINFYLNGKEANLFGSQGQQRSIVLSLKISEVYLIKEIFNILPILLLDDVGSELDMFRKKSLIDIIEEDMQTFITTTQIENLPDNILEKATIYDTESFISSEA